jgi:uncharacterized DUF497 family protein
MPTSGSLICASTRSISPYSSISEWDTAVIDIDDDEHEERMIAYGFIGTKLHVLVYAERGDKIRAISLRIAEKHEKRYYDGQV